jgi:hypothetical protein
MEELRIDVGTGALQIYLRGSAEKSWSLREKLKKPKNNKISKTKNDDENENNCRCSMA